MQNHWYGPNGGEVGQLKHSEIKSPCALSVLLENIDSESIINSSETRAIQHKDQICFWLKGKFAMPKVLEEGLGGFKNHSTYFTRYFGPKKVFNSIWTKHCFFGNHTIWTSDLVGELGL